MQKTLKWSLGMLVIVGALTLERPEVGAQQSAENVAWMGGRWFDGIGFRSVDVYSTGRQLTLQRPVRVDRSVDLTGRFVTAPFAEAHNHNIPGVPTAEAVIQGYLRQGIFYVMIQENTPAARSRVLPLINGAATVDVVFANGAFTAPGGHPSALVARNVANKVMTPADAEGAFIHSVASNRDVDRVWGLINDQRPDFIKFVLVYSEDRIAGIPRPTTTDRHGLDPALAAYIVKMAHARQLRVSAHVESAYDFEVAVNAGADVIAHMPGFWPDPARIAAHGTRQYRITEAAAVQAARQRAIVVTTMGGALRALGSSLGDSSMRRDMLDVYRHNLDVLRKHKVRIAIGSDEFRGTSVQEALELHATGLMSNANLLTALTSDAIATIFPARAPVGPFEGAAADFVVLQANPLEDITAIERIVLRVKSGRELSVN